MAALKQRVIFVLALVLVLAGQARAGAAEELREYVDTNTQKLVEKLNSERNLYSTDPEAFYASMNEALEGFVDFRRIAARVMGRYARQTTRDQRDAFVAKFKRSLFDSYAQALVEADDFVINVLDAVINPQNENRASVDMEVTTASGNRYPVTYSMYRNRDGNWMMENVIVEGVNIGLAFRDRFAQEVEANRGQIQAVIDGWDSVVESLDLENKDVEKS